MEEETAEQDMGRHTPDPQSFFFRQVRGVKNFYKLVRIRSWEITFGHHSNQGWVAGGTWGLGAEEEAGPA